VNGHGNNNGNGGVYGGKKRHGGGASEPFLPMHARYRQSLGTDWAPEVCLNHALMAAVSGRLLTSRS